MHQCTGNVEKIMDYLDDRHLFRLKPSFVRDLGSSDEFCDVVIVSEDGSDRKAHKLVLVDCSHYFYTLFCSPAKHTENKTEVLVPGVDRDIMKLLMAHAYRQRVPVTNQNVCKLLLAADYLMMPRLKELCIEVIQKEATVDTCIEVLTILDLIPEVLGLSAKYRMFVKMNFELIVETTDTIPDLMLQELVELLSSDDDGVISFKVALAAVERWVRGNPQLAEEALPKLVNSLGKNHFDSKLVLDTLDIKRIVSRIEGGESALEILNYEGSLFFQPVTPTEIMFLVHKGEGFTEILQVYPSPNAYLEGTYKVVSNVENFEAYECFLIGSKLHMFDAMANCGKSYDLIERTWRDMPPLIFKPSSYTIGELNCQLYFLANLVNGWDDAPIEITVNETINPDSNTWDTVPTMQSVHYNLKAASLQGYLYVVGCSNSDIMHIEMERWLLGDGLIWRKMADPTVKSYVRLFFEHGGYLYIFGNSNTTNRHAVERYLPELNSWFPLPDLPHLYGNLEKVVMRNTLILYDDYAFPPYDAEPVYWDESTFEWRDVTDHAPWPNADIHVKCAQKFFLSVLNDTSVVQAIHENRGEASSNVVSMNDMGQLSQFFKRGQSSESTILAHR